jgi:transcriptional repressor NrdR
MQCPYCKAQDTKVLDSRVIENGTSIRRRRYCFKCKKRFTTYEKPELLTFMVVKKDGSRQAFDRQKLLAGILKACEKRPVGVEAIEQAVQAIEKKIYSKYEKEVASHVIGELVMKTLYKLDEVAYVRFASVYRQFKDINQFMFELKHLLNGKS